MVSIQFSLQTTFWCRLCKFFWSEASISTQKPHLAKDHGLKLKEPSTLKIKQNNAESISKHEKTPAHQMIIQYLIKKKKKLLDKQVETLNKKDSTDLVTLVTQRIFRTVFNTVKSNIGIFLALCYADIFNQI